MPMKNAAPWIEGCIQSIQRQEFTDWELLVINDHSTDNSLQLVNKIARLDKRIKTLNNTGQGIIPALELAFINAKGKFVTRMDADDLMPRGKLKWFYEALACEDEAIVTGKVHYFTDDGSPVSAGYLQYESWLNARIDNEDHWKWIYRECVIASANWMAPRHLFSANELVYPEDYKLVFNWYKKGVKIIALNKITHHWREHEKRTSRTSEHYNQGHFFKLKLNEFLALDFDPNKSIIVLGEQKKAKLIKNHFSIQGIKYLQFGKDQIEHLPNASEAQVLIAVFPPLNERIMLEKYLNHKGFIQGIGFWWL